MNSAISIEKKKKPIPPPIIAIHATTCCFLVIFKKRLNSLLNLIDKFQTVIIRMTVRE